ncbi:NuoI/complex I 23 kDa subunit family protein [Caldithrix abyssi]|uniref:NADH-quinone oxidoreductase subunit I n=1 Tax=Caldithrix abyssi DSM 13497 TaxID=880073 RepID=H1XQ46_CALAY|nr:NADH-quinone oxidoreductase subunit I [Caldithrix abyssi]APF18275.1 nuoI NADH-quinone oxidoreductase subunit I [Caldithrix abyssi DSM 13497]EHO42297.1 NAD(P)H-quinone oxidoreductase subunit I [Caldithrix abyssi DSM 13497]
MVEYFKNIYEAVVTILIGMGVTFKHLFVPSVTVQYPKEKVELPPRSRMQLFVRIEDCIGCRQCERACPVDCIEIDLIKAGKDEDLGLTSNGKKKPFHVIRFDIDMSKCCFCNLCTFPCPTECIHMTPDYEYAQEDRSNLIFQFSNYTAEQVAELQKREAEKAAARAAAKAKTGGSGTPAN